jgi:hypothetical protein
MRTDDFEMSESDEDANEESSSDHHRDLAVTGFTENRPFSPSDFKIVFNNHQGTQNRLDDGNSALPRLKIRIPGAKNAHDVTVESIDKEISQLKLPYIYDPEASSNHMAREETDRSHLQRLLDQYQPNNIHTSQYDAHHDDNDDDTMMTDQYDLVREKLRKITERMNDFNDDGKFQI